MTTWQDEPPMSRRALRERERAQTRAAEEQASPASPSFRVRDYSPEARGNQFSTVGSVDAAVPPRHVTPPSAAPEPVVVERTLTRRELRAIREAAEQVANPMAEAPRAPEPASGWAAGHQGSPVAQPAQYTPPALVDPLDQPAAPPRPSVAEPPPPVPTPAPQAAPPLSWLQQPEPAPDVVVVPPTAFAPPVPEFDLPPEFDAAPPQARSTRPEGHWSRQADIDDKTQLGDILLPGRDLSRSDAITTSALVLPSMPDNPIGPLSSGGEILVTGSIDLPRMLGATGVHPARFDHSEVDSIIDAADREESHPNSSPVRAIRAVSTHTSTQGIIAAKRPRSKLPTYVLAGVATVMGAGVVVLFVGGMLLDLF